MTVLLCATVVGLALLMPAPAGAETQGEAIVSVAEGVQSQGYPYCFDGGTLNGPSAGGYDEHSDGSYSDCRTTPGKVGFDCTGLTLYAVYQATGNAGLSHGPYQATSGNPGGQVIGSEAALQPGDVVYFDYNASHGLGYIDHAGIYVGQSGGHPMVLSAVSEKWGIRTEPISWYEAGGLHFVGGVRFWHGNSGPPPPPPVHHSPFDVNGDGVSDMCFLTGVNGGGTGSGDLEVHCGLGSGFSSRIDAATSFGYLSTQTAPPYLADVNGDGKADMCFLTGVNGGTTGSGSLEVHCALGSGFSSRIDAATSFGYINTQDAMPFFADVNGDGNADMCFLTGVNGGTTGSGSLEVHCALGPDFQSRIDAATSFGYINMHDAMPFFADVNGDGKADMCFLTGVNGGTTGSGSLEVHCALGPGFSSRIDTATSFAYLNTRTALPFFADVNGDGKADMCFLTGVNGGTTGSGSLEVHCALGPDFSSRLDAATTFGYLDALTSWVLDGGAGVPLAPGSASATAGDHSANVSFSEPLFDGGNPITSYTVTSSPGGITATGSSSPITVSGLANGTSYTFTVTAANAFGLSLPSAPTNTMTPTSSPITPPSTTTTSTTSTTPTTTTSSHGVLGTNVHGTSKRRISALSRALAKCHRIKSHRKRTKCETAARRRYHPRKREKKN